MLLASVQSFKISIHSSTRSFVDSLVHSSLVNQVGKTKESGISRSDLIAKREKTDKGKNLRKTKLFSNFGSNQSTLDQVSQLWIKSLNFGSTLNEIRIKRSNQPELVLTRLVNTTLVVLVTVGRLVHTPSVGGEERACIADAAEGRLEAPNNLAVRTADNVAEEIVVGLAVYFAAVAKVVLNQRTFAGANLAGHPVRPQQKLFSFGRNMAASRSGRACRRATVLEGRLPSATILVWAACF